MFQEHLNGIKTQDDDHGLIESDGIEKVESSTLSRILQGAVALVVIIGLIYISGAYQYLFYKRTPPSAKQAPVESRIDAETLIVPLTIFIVTAKEPYGSIRSKENAINLVENASRIWDQAGISLVTKSIYEIEKGDKEIEVFYDTPYLFFQDIGEFDETSINAFLIGNLRGINGIAFGGARSIAVADYTTVYDFRAFAHEVGHVLGLDHVSGSRGQLMYRGANGFDLSLVEIERARISAQEFNMGS